MVALKPALDVMDSTAASIGITLFACVMAESGKPVTSFPDGRVLGEYEIVCEEGLMDRR
ncbi:MAG: hypothetical protein JJD96_02895 [Thermoleophilia bacterium]|nr:hypothetical protein [Thermoleophilia bacterium]